MYLIIFQLIIFSIKVFGFAASDLVLQLNQKLENDHNCQYSFIFLIDKTNGTGNIRNIILFIENRKKLILYIKGMKNLTEVAFQNYVPIVSLSVLPKHLVSSDIIVV